MLRSRLLRRRYLLDYMVTDVTTHEPDEVALARAHHVLRKLPPAASDPALCHGILTGTAA
jgi:hypothetical protein